MSDKVAIIGLGYTPLRAATADQSFKELTFAAAQAAYADAGVRFDEIGSFVTCAEDFNAGISIFDEYTPDQLGAVQKPMHTLTHDGLCGIADAAMQIRARVADLVVVEAHSKASNIATPDWVLDYALDPVYNRPLGFNPHALAALEMNSFLNATGITTAQCAEVVVANRRHACANPLAAYPLDVNGAFVEASPYFSFPLHLEEMAKHADGCVVVVLASEARARQVEQKPIWISGIGFAGDSPTLESRDWVEAPYARRAAAMAYRQAALEPRDIDLFEVDDTYAYKQLQHLRAVGAEIKRHDLMHIAESFFTKPAVNISGGALGMGDALEASSLYRIVEIVLQLRGAAEARQLEKPKFGLAQSWRGVPAASGAVVILGAA